MRRVMNIYSIPAFDSCVSGQNFKSWIQLALVIIQSFCSFEYEY